MTVIDAMNDVTTVIGFDYIREMALLCVGKTVLSQYNAIHHV